MNTTSFRIFAMAMNDWHGPWMNRQQLLSRLGKKHQIIFSNGLLSIWDRHTDQWNKSPALLTKLGQDNNIILHRPPKILSRIPKLKFIDNLIIRIGVFLQKKYLGKLGNGPTIVYIFNPEFAIYAKRLKPDYVVYHAYDLYNMTPGWNSQLEEQQNYLLKYANLILASSEKIAHQLESISGRHVTVLPNAADYDAFKNAYDNKGIIPEDLNGIPEPRIGYIGNINRKVDLPLIANLAATHNNWNFVIVGGIGNLDSNTRSAYEHCQDLPNVYFLGSKKHDQLPLYLSYMNIALMCYRIGNSLWTEGIYPLKMHEYLSAGLPVISADIPSVREFSQVIDIAHNETEWAQAITHALTEQDNSLISARRKVAKENSWSKRTETLNKLLQDMVR